MLMMRSNQKVTPPPPVPPRPNKTIVAEALAKSRRLSPIRALYATQPLSAVDIPNGNGVPKLSKDPQQINNKPVVPIRAAPPPPLIKPKPNGHIPQPQIVKSFSTAMVFNPKLRSINDTNNKVIRSASDASDDPNKSNINNKSRPIVYQSSNAKTSKLEVNLCKKPSVKRVETTKNEINKSNEDKQTIKITSTPVESTDNKTHDNIISVVNNRHLVKINNSCPESEETPPNNSSEETNKFVIEENKIADHIIDVIVQSNEKTVKLAETIVQSSDKTTIIVTNKEEHNDDDPDNNNSLKEQLSDSSNEKDKDSRSSTTERIANNNKKVQFDDKINHELLIAELQVMKEEQERLLKRQRKPPVDIYDCDNESVNSDVSRIQHSDWIEVANNGEEVRLSSCQIYIDNPSDDSTKSSSFSSCSSRKPQRAPSMSSLHGLPPLPKSLSGFNLLDNNSTATSTPTSHRIETPRGTYRVPASPGPQTPSRAGSSRGTTPPTPGSGSGHVVYPPHPRVNGTNEIPKGRKITTLDTQLAILRREMYGLRQLDLSLLSQLYSLNEAIQDFRQMLQDQEDSALSPHSPSPSPSSGDEGDEFFSPAPIRFKPAPPAPPLRRTSNSSSANSSEYGTV